VGQVRTFSVANEDPAEDETAYALAVAQRYGTRHQVLPVRGNVRKDLPTFVATMGEPMADASAVNMFAIAKMARESVTVALTGDGGDEGFGGYTESWAVRYAERIWRALPRPARSWAAACSEVVRRAGTLLRLASHPLEQSFGALLPEETLLRNALYSPELHACLGTINPRRHIHDLLICNHGEPWANRHMQMDAQTRLPDDYLTKVDLATMGASLEARCPFLDLDVMNVAMRIPVAIRFGQGEPKGLLRRLARRHLPVRGVNRRKQGFTVPVGLWLRKDWSDLVDDLILGGHVEQRGWFCRKTLERVVDEHRQGRDHATLLWTLLILELWVRLAVDRTLDAHDEL
jgi:asparagine synthase (glutamine-hydrolysing)